MFDAMIDSWDQDNDGAVLDDGLAWSTNLAGNGLAALGGLMVAGGGGLAALGGAEAATLFGAPLGLSQAALGTAIGIAGAGVGGLGLLMASDAAASTAEEVGDFTSDLLGTRDAPPFPSSDIGDPFYKEGRTDGLGQSLNRAITGFLSPATPAPPPSLADVLTPPAQE